MKISKAEVGDSIFFSCGNKKDVEKLLSLARDKIARDLDLIDESNELLSKLIQNKFDIIYLLGQDSFKFNKKDDSIYVTNLDGPLKHLENKWYFKEINNLSFKYFKNSSFERVITNTTSLKFFCFTNNSYIYFFVIFAITNDWERLNKITFLY